MALEQQKVCLVGRLFRTGKTRTPAASESGLHTAASELLLRRSHINRNRTPRGISAS